MAFDPTLITNAMANWQPPPVFDPLARFAKLQALQSGVLQQQVQKAQLQSYQAEGQQRQMDLRDGQTVMQALQNPATAKAVASWTPGTPFPLASLGLQWKTVQGIQDKVLGDQKTALGLSEDQRKATEAKHAQIGTALEGLAYNADGTPRSDADIAQNAPGTFQGLITAGIIPQGTPMPQINGAADLQKYAVLNNYQQGLNQWSQAAQGKAQEIATAKAAAGKDTAQAAQADAEATKAKEDARKAKMVNDAMAAAQQNPAQGLQLIDNALPATVDPRANAAYKAAWQAATSAGDIDGAARIVATAASHAASISPAALKFAADKAAAEARAKGPIETANELAKQAALAKGSTEMFAGIPDPVARRAAQNKFETITEAYYDKDQTAAQLKDFIAAAQSGNKAAPGLIPLSELRTLVNRVNRQELEAIGGAGSTLDKVQGWFQGKTEGQPIPPDILRGIGQIADIQARNNRAAYNNKVNSLNATYGGNIRAAQPGAPDPGAPGAQPGAGAPGAAQPAGAPGGGQTVTKAQVQDYATKHSLSYADAEAHVKANGYVVK
jgi:hypothetical protein